MKLRADRLYIPEMNTSVFPLNVAYDRENFYPRREWATPGGTAIPGQPVAKAEQAPDTSPSSKNQFNIIVSRWDTYQILS